MADSENDSVSVWCHTCNQETTAHRNEEYGEYECDECQNTFVEELNQGIETFIQANEPQTPDENQQRSESVQSNNSRNVESPPIDPNIIINQILGRGLGISGAQFPNSTSDDENNSGISIINQISGNTRRPVGIVIRHPSSFGSESGDSIQGVGAGTGLPRGLFALLNSISSIRQNHHNPDAMSDARFEQFLHHILMNESSHAGAPPASESVIESLKKLNITELTDLSGLGECCISQEHFEVGDTVVCLPCGHNYKEEPIVHWLKMHNTCPVCRIDINTTTST